MLRMKNSGELLVPLTVGGAQAVANDVASVIAPFTGFIAAIYAKLSTAGITSTQNTDIKKNGTTIFASGAAALQFPTTVANCTYGALAAANPVPVTKGDVIRLDTTAINTTPGRGLTVILVFRRGRSAGGARVTETDTIGSESDTI
jgi:hypothetical protein